MSPSPFHASPGPRPTTAPAARLLTEPDAGIVLGVSARTIFTLAASGELDVVRIGRAKRITSESIERFIARKVAARTTGGAQ